MTAATAPLPMTAWQQYYALTKPRVVQLIVFCALIGMVLAGQPGLPLPCPIRRLVLNDVGPAITWSSVLRMQTYVGQYGQYRDLDEAAAALWTLSQGFGPVLPEVWREKLLNGWDDIDLTVSRAEAIATFRAGRKMAAPWVWPNH